MNEGNIAIRLKGFMENQGLSYSQFADTCGIPRPSLSQILNGRNKKVSDIILTQIHDAFPQLSITWLLFGEGDMYGSIESLPSQTAKNEGTAGNSLDFTDNMFNDAPFGFEEQVAMPPREIMNVVQKAQSKTNSSSVPRKVVSITVFYDDNSYEVFSPAKK